MSNGCGSSFSKETSNYTLEYGKDIHPQGYSEAIVSTNNMRPSGGITVNTGPLKFTLKKKGMDLLMRYSLTKIMIRFLVKMN